MMLLVRYKNRATVFQYDVKRKDVAETLAMHLAHWRYESADPQGADKTEIPHGDVVAEWVEGETVESVAVPPYAKK